jgi:hypothetical protein
LAEGWVDAAADHAEKAQEQALKKAAKLERAAKSSLLASKQAQEKLADAEKQLNALSDVHGHEFDEKEQEVADMRLETSKLVAAGNKTLEELQRQAKHTTAEHDYAKSLKAKAADAKVLVEASRTLEKARKTALSAYDTGKVEAKDSIALARAHVDELQKVYQAAKRNIVNAGGDMAWHAAKEQLTRARAKVQQVAVNATKRSEKLKRMFEDIRDQSARALDKAESAAMNVKKMATSGGVPESKFIITGGRDDEPYSTGIVYYCGLASLSIVILGGLMVVRKLSASKRTVALQSSAEREPFWPTGTQGISRCICQEDVPFSNDTQE